MKWPRRWGLPRKDLFGKYWFWGLLYVVGVLALALLRGVFR